MKKDTDNTDIVPSADITLKSFHAEADHDGRVTLQWKTSAETDTAGFNLYRSRHKRGRYTKVNNVLINTRDTDQSGVRYHFVDEPDHSRVYYYKLEHVDYYGETTGYAPVKARTKSFGNK